MNDPPARQVIRKIAARLASREALYWNAGGLGLGLIRACRRRQFLELQFELIDQALAALGARAEQLALHLRDHQLKVFDQRLGAGQFGARFDQRCFQRILVVGKMMISCRCHEASASQIRLIRRRNSQT